MNSDAEFDVPEHVPAHLVKHFNFRINPAMEIDPWAEFATLNDAPDIFYSPEQEGYWAVTNATIIEEILAKTDIFSSAYNSIPRMQDDMRLIPPNLDPPEHTPYRKIITQKIFRTEIIDSLEKDARATLRERIAKIVDKGECDFKKEIAGPFPIAVFLKLMGMPDEHLAEFADTIEVFFRGEKIEEVTAARQTVFGFAQRWLDSDPDAEGAHMLRELRAAEIDGRPISGEELTIMVLTLFFAGLDTVTAQMSFMAHFLATHPEYQRRLLDNPADIANAVEEMLRRFGIANLCRYVTRDVEFQGVQMKKGDLVMVSSAMAGVDESTYENASTVNFDRPKVRRHAAFGKGVHRCAGERLARMELNVLWQEAIPALRNMRLKPGTEYRFLPGTIMSMTGLPIIWDTPAA